MAPWDAAVQQAAFEKALLGVDRVALRSLVAELEARPDALRLLEGLLVPVLERIGRGWHEGRVSLAQVYMAGRLCEVELQRLPVVARQSAESAPRLALAVLEDSHLLGMRVVLATLRLAGWPVLSLGRMELEPLVARVKRERISILLVSTLMLPAALQVRSLVDRLREEGLATRVVVGGAPFRFDTELWQEVGADACGSSASDAIGIVRRLSESRA